MNLTIPSTDIYTLMMTMFARLWRIIAPGRISEAGHESIIATQTAKVRYGSSQTAGTELRSGQIQLTIQVIYS